MISLNKPGFATEKYSTGLSMLCAASLLKSSVVASWFGALFTFATQVSKSARVGVAIVLNFIPEKPRPLKLAEMPLYVPASFAIKCS
ncbi:hypothetical protein SRABI106_04189 [Rahnella aquatilis]|nr:hypothetical protein SRABI106_04189 [Rahnella aquatilis]